MILSVSRRTDVPNYYSDWFVNRIKEGFLYVRNPMNAHQISRIDLSPDVVDCIVFWTKNPANMMEKLECLKDYVYYFQFTLTGYGKDIEPNLPNKREELISTFKALSKKIGKERVIWRDDPILINKKYTTEYHKKVFEEISCSLAVQTPARPPVHNFRRKARGCSAAHNRSARFRTPLPPHTHRRFLKRICVSKRIHT